MVEGTPRAEVSIDLPLIQSLLAEQRPELSELPVIPVGEGWDNSLFRIGDAWIMRLPRRAAAVPLLENEQRVLSHLATTLPVFVPAPVFIGAPCETYPWPWSITRYVDGLTLDQSPLNRQGVMQWVDFLVVLHRPLDLVRDPTPPDNPHRGVPLEHRRVGLEERVRQLRSFGIEFEARLFELWGTALRTATTERRVWLHGDPHPRNLLGRNGQLAAVLDWGDVTAGDPASDLASLWMVANTPKDRRDGLERYCAKQQAGFVAQELRDLIIRSMGWAFVHGCIHLAAGLIDHPAHAAIGRATLNNLADDLDSLDWA